MEQILSQLGGLLLAAVPTIVLLLLTFAAYNWLVHRPLQRVLEERYSLTQGAQQKAQADIAAAEAKAAEHEQRIREARVAIFKAQDARRQQALAARTAVLSEARAVAEQTVRRERERLQADVAAARGSLAGEAERLANQIISAILRPTAVAQPTALSGRRS